MLRLMFIIHMCVYVQSYMRTYAHVYIIILSIYVY